MKSRSATQAGKLFIALSVSAVILGATVLGFWADQRRVGFEDVLSTLGAQLERTEERIAELEVSQAAMLAAIRERSTQEAELTQRLGEAERAVEARAEFATLQELEEVVAAVNDVVTVVDEFSDEFSDEAPDLERKGEDNLGVSLADLDSDGDVDVYIADRSLYTIRLGVQDVAPSRSITVRLHGHK